MLRKILNVLKLSVISSSVPSNVGLNTETSFYDHLEFISSDFSCTSSVTSSRSGMGKFRAFAFFGRFRNRFNLINRFR